MGVEEGGSLFIDRNGAAPLSGQDAYVVLGDHQSEQAVAGKPLTFSNDRIWHLTPGSTHDVANRPACGSYTRSVVNGNPDASLSSGTAVC
ncbi:hypothetical protein AB0K51_32040 [Kitasatospora sp. NPDC049285]|uniref:hypothetical protein n=1 Tax=Kitasatospora sp. NPDC049285 TaxID=3157096 RepID=UPI00343E7B67